jgi:trans-2,3-dihydro-3-hydroxyanthranilate isomerase
VSSLAYEIVDVFTDRPFTGNPLAVVFDGEHLDSDQMRSLAREFNLSETAFVLPPTVEGASYRLRIFTPAAELPFAGHPSVGSAVTLYRRGLLPAGPAHQECGAGVLPIVVHPEGRATLTGGVPTLGPALDAAPYLAAAGLAAADLVGPPVRVAGCGLEFAYLAVRPSAVAQAAGHPAAVAAQPYVFAWDEASRQAHARLFAHDLGVSEDPATGSAALGLGVFLVGSGLLPADGQTGYTVRQGIEIHRPSTLECVVSAAGGVAEWATVTGSVVPVAKGEIAVPPFVG